MEYEVIKLFTDLEDDGFRYRAGDIYPRAGYEPSEKRIDELSGWNNKQGMPLIKARYKPAESVTEDIPAKVEETAKETPEKPKRTRRKSK